MFAFLQKFIAPADTGKGKAKSKAATPEAAPPPPSAAAAPAAPQFEVDRFELLQMLWGTGFSAPNDKDFIKGITASLTLDAQKSVLDLSAGLGGQARLIAEIYKTYVTGFERDSDLAFNGNKISQRTGFGRNAPITHYDPHSFEHPKRVDAIIARDILYSIKDKDAFAVRVGANLKDRGHLVLTDFTCDPAQLQNPSVAMWAASEPGVHMISQGDLTKLFARHGFDVRVTEDITQAYMKMTLRGMARLVKNLEGKKLSPTMKAMVGKEVNFWAMRLAALDTAVKYTRLHAIKID